MSAIRKIAFQGVRNAARSGFKAPFVTRNMSSVIEKKEHADEARYIREIENRRKEEIRANLERIMALEDSHEEKTNLVGLLGIFLFHFIISMSSIVTINIVAEKKKEDTGLINKLGLNDWKFAIPTAMLLSVPLIKNEVCNLPPPFILFLIIFSCLYFSI
jgi:hypothetical protein